MRKVLFLTIFFVACAFSNDFVEFPLQDTLNSKTGKKYLNKGINFAFKCTVCS